MNLGIRATGLVAVTALLLTGCSPSGGDSASEDGDGIFAGRTLTVQTWGGAVQEAEQIAFYTPFEEATGATVKVVEAVSDVGALLKKQVDSGSPEWDLVTGQPAETIELWAEQDLLEPIDYSAVPGSNDLPAAGVHEFGLGYSMPSAVAAYTTRDGVDALTSMDDFFDVDTYPGDRMAPNWGTASVQCEAALLADGVAVEDLYPIDIDHCLEVWERVKPSVTVWFTAGNQMIQALVEDSVDYCLCWDGRVELARQTNPNWDVTYTGAQTFFDLSGIVKGSANADMAAAMIEIMTDPEAQAIYAEHIGYSPSNEKAVEFLPSELQERVAIAPHNAAVSFVRPEGVQIENREEIERAWAAFLAE